MKNKFRHYQRVAYVGCEFEFIEMVNSHQAIIRNNPKLRQPDQVVSASKLSLFRYEKPRETRY